MIESDILKALQTGVIAAVATTTLPSTSVKMVGRTFVPPSNGKWLEVIYIPNNIENEFWDAGKTYRGILRLLLHWPMGDKGAYEGLRMAESLAGYFAKGSILTSGSATVRITDEPNLTNLLEEPPELLFPVSVRYVCFKA